MPYLQSFGRGSIYTVHVDDLANNHLQSAKVGKEVIFLDVFLCPHVCLRTKIDVNNV